MNQDDTTMIVAAADQTYWLVILATSRVCASLDVHHQLARDYSPKSAIELTESL